MASPVEPHDPYAAPPTAKCETRVEYFIDAEKALVVVRLSRKITALEIQAYTERLRQEAQFKPTFSEIIDLRAVEGFAISPEEAIVLADQADPFALSSRRAFVASNDFQINSARVHKMLRSPAKNMAIFGTMEEAENWVRAADPGKLGRVIPFFSRLRS